MTTKVTPPATYAELLQRRKDREVERDRDRATRFRLGRLRLQLLKAERRLERQRVATDGAVAAAGGRVVIEGLTAPADQFAALRDRIHDARLAVEAELDRKAARR